ncbi:MAG: replication factor C large subunit [Candidatus Aenigmarchaeota archaeon]|nr:replication factor C large subunit [Candidatus Aenigmarchaeota archaeon]
MELWTGRHRPRSLKEMAGHGKSVEEIAKWLDLWKPGRGLLIHGGPGVGKNLIVELLSRERNLLLLEASAPDISVEQLENMSVAGSSRPLFHKGKLILIDEVDGISSRERGAVAAVSALIRSSSYPVVLTANDIWNQKLRPLRALCDAVKLGKIPSPSIEKRLKEICKAEGVAVEDGALKALARWSQGDMRSVLVDLQLLLGGRKELTMADLESLGFRERENSVFNIMPTIFNSGSMSTAKNAIRTAGMDPDDIFWWIENNIPNVFKNPGEIANAYDILSKADLFRRQVIVQQNWRFKAYMIDIMSAVSTAGKPAGGFIPYQPPQRLIQLGATRAKRQAMQELCTRLGAHLHCSTRSVKRDYLPFLKALVKKKKLANAGGIDLSEDDVKLIRAY